MKNPTRITALTMIAFAMLILVFSCKKDEEDPIPTFTLTYDSVAIVSGGKGLQFFAKCTNNGVTMTNVTITNPAAGLYVYDAKGTSYEKNADIPMQGSGEAYQKKTGNWKFKLAGSSKGGTAFTFDATVAVSY